MTIAGKNVVAIIQARMGSSRLPGKVLAKVGHQPMLAQVLDRVAAARMVDQLVVATTVDVADNPIKQVCQKRSVACFRGSREDVLDRYYRAAIRHRADVVVRVTADCPLVDPGVIDRVVRAFLNERPDYASNTLRRTYPRGLDTEIFSTAALERAWREASEPYMRTHVTPYFYWYPERFRLLAVDGNENHAEHRWTVDVPADLELVRAVHARLSDKGPYSWRDVLRLVVREPDLANLNRHVCQKILVQG